MGLPSKYSSISKEIAEVQELCESVYSENFGSYFYDANELFNKVKKHDYIIRDSELEWILTTLPINLFSVSEAISHLRVAQEVIKSEIKKQEYSVTQTSNAKTVSERKEEAAIASIDNRLLLSVYDSVITRVETEVSMSRELIMGAKKIWDSRKRTDASMPVNPVNLPDYIKGA